MAQRHIRVMGAAYSESGNAEITVNFNNQLVYNGATVNTTNTTPPAGNLPNDSIVTLAEFDIDLATTGNIPLSVTVNKGSLIFATLEGNYSGFTADIVAATPGTPIDWNNAATYVVNSVTTRPEDFYQDVNINTIETDGKTNVLIDDIPQVRTVIDPTQDGDWHYRIAEGSTLTCDIYIDPTRIVETLPGE